MKCPFMLAGLHAYRGGGLGDDDNCIQQGCALWDHAGDLCAVLSIAAGMAAISDQLEEMLKHDNG